MKDKPTSLSPLTRRQFLYYSTVLASAAAFPAIARPSPRRVSPNDKLNIAVIGCGGKGSSDLRFCSGENIVALCDVSESSTAAARRNFPNAKIYKDYRELLDKEKSLDAVDIATPDHMHAVIAANAMELGKHVYC